MKAKKIKTNEKALKIKRILNAKENSALGFYEAFKKAAAATKK